MYSTSHLDLDRSPSLSSNSSNSGASSVPSVPTPQLPPSSTFPSSTYPSSPQFTGNGKDHYDHNLAKSSLNSSSNSTVSSPSGYRSRTESMLRDGTNTRLDQQHRSPWSAGHKTGAGSASFDSARARFGSNASTANKDLFRTTSVKANLSEPGTLSRYDTSPWRSNRSPSRLEPVKTGTDSIGSSTSPTPSSPTTFAFPLSAAPASPTRRSPLPPTPQPGSPTRRGLNSPFAPGSPSSREVGKGSVPFPPSSPSRSPARSIHSPHMHTPNSNSAQALSSAIFATRDSPSSPVIARGAGLGRFDSISSSASGRAGTHRRAMTLPQNFLPPTLDQAQEQVAGLPGRARLSRPADAPSSFAPSAVFSSSHGLARQAAGHGSPLPSGSLLPSHTVKAIDRQRQNLVAYEYLCHVRE